MPSLIRPRYRFITTYTFSDSRFVKVPRSAEKKWSGGSTPSDYT
nr:hypothetical protein [Candidatus Enterovibrio escacola]